MQIKRTLQFSVEMDIEMNIPETETPEYIERKFSVWKSFFKMKIEVALESMNKNQSNKITALRIKD